MNNNLKILLETIHFEDLLNNAANYAKLMDIDVSELIMNLKYKKVKEVHPYSIKQLSKGKRLWQTIVKLEVNQKTKKITGVTQEILIAKLYDYYFVDVVPTVADYYSTWIELRKSENIVDTTINRYNNYWDRYYRNHSIVQKKLHRISIQDIENFFHEQIKTHEMTLKELNNMKVILKGILKLAKKRQFISTNPFLEAEIQTYGCRPPKKDLAESRIYFDNEKQLLFDALNEEIKLFPKCTIMHGIFLLFSKGIRIGELAAIKLEDVDFKNEKLYIHRMETIKKDEVGNNITAVVNYTKKKSPSSIRWLDLEAFEINLINEIIKINHSCNYKEASYLFLDENGRKTSRSFDYRIRKLCKKIGIKAKSAHDIRRTFASQLYADGTNIKDIQEILGHADESTTRSYIYDFEKEEIKRRKLSISLSKMDGFQVTKGD